MIAFALATLVYWRQGTKPGVQPPPITSISLLSHHPDRI